MNPTAREEQVPGGEGVDGAAERCVPGVVCVVPRGGVEHHRQHVECERVDEIIHFVEAQGHRREGRYARLGAQVDHRPDSRWSGFAPMTDGMTVRPSEKCSKFFR